MWPVRGNYVRAAPGVRDAMLHLQEEIGRAGLETALLDLVYLRASQINGCAFCIDMHWKDLRAAGESEARLYMLQAWTEAVTLVTEGHVPDEVYREAREQFTEAELAWLTLAAVAINGWNRLNVAFQMPAGHYRPAARGGDGA